MKRFFKRLTDRRPHLSAREIILWWELRRIPYNLIVGCAGLATGAIALGAGWIVESRGGEAIFPDPPLFAIVAAVLYGVAANVCYTLGWVFELLARKWWSAEAAGFGRLSFMFGLIGSVILTLIPAGLVVFGSIVELFAHHPAAR